MPYAPTHVLCEPVRAQLAGRGKPLPMFFACSMLTHGSEPRHIQGWLRQKKTKSANRSLLFLLNVHASILTHTQGPSSSQGARERVQNAWRHPDAQGVRPAFNQSPVFPFLFDLVVYTLSSIGRQWVSGGWGACMQLRGSNHPSEVLITLDPYEIQSMMKRGNFLGKRYTLVSLARLYFPLIEGSC